MSMSDPVERAAKWKSRVQQAIAVRKSHETRWQENIEAYRGTPVTKDRTGDEWINVNKDFANVEQKKALLFFQSPNVQLTPTEVMAGREQAVALHEAVLDQKLGPHGVDAKRLMDLVLFDVLCPSGIGATKIGYDRVLVTVDRPVLQPLIDPMTGAPAMGPDGLPQQTPQLDEAGEPVTEPVDVPIFEECYWRHIPTKKLLIPHDFHGSDYDQAPWLGMQFTMPKRQAPKDWRIPDDLTSGSVDEKELRYDHGEPGDAKSQEPMISGAEIWYKASLYDEDVQHPQWLRQLVLIDGMDEPAVLKDSSDQTVGPDGRLTPDSLIGFPIHVLTIRDLADSAYPPSDCSVTRAQVDELCKFRTQLTQQRDMSLPIRGIDTSRVSPEIADKISRAEFQWIIPFDGPHQDAIWSIDRAQYPRENFVAQDYIQRDIQETMAIGANQLGQQEEKDTTATEVQTIQQASNVRMDAERQRVLTWFAKGVGKLDALLQRYMTTESYIQYLGPQGQLVEQLWDRQAIAGRFAYDIKPDSAVYVDADARRRQVMHLYNFLRKDPVVNPNELVTMVAREWNLAPEKIIAPPPPPQPPQPNVSVRVVMEDIVGPAGHVALKILQTAGYPINEQDLMQAQQNNLMRLNATVAGEQAQVSTEHGGPSEKTELLNKRQSEESGALPGGYGVQ